MNMDWGERERVSKQKQEISAWKNIIILILRIFTSGKNSQRSCILYDRRRYGVDNRFCRVHERENERVRERKRHWVGNEKHMGWVVELWLNIFSFNPFSLNTYLCMQQQLKAYVSSRMAKKNPLSLSFVGVVELLDNRKISSCGRSLEGHKLVNL
mgnify:CR=1 FL=1